MCIQAWNEPKHIVNRNQRTDTVGTNPDLFCIHAEVPANKREGRDPSCSRGIAIKLSGLSRVRVPAPKGPKHIANTKRKDWHCRNQSRSLLYACQRTRKQGESFQSHLCSWGIAIKLSILSSHAPPPTVQRMDQNTWVAQTKWLTLLEPCLPFNAVYTDPVGSCKPLCKSPRCWDRTIEAFIWIPIAMSGGVSKFAFSTERKGLGHLCSVRPIAILKHRVQASSW